MRLEREIRETEETLGHKIEHKVGDFIQSSFDCVEKIERTEHLGINDKKGIDLVITFENGGKMAIDVTADDGERVDSKVKSMTRSPLVGISEELSNGETVVEESKDLVPRALIRVYPEKWQEYNVEKINDEIIVYMADKVRVNEEKDILKQLLSQIDYFSKSDSGYKKRTTEIKKMLSSTLEEVEDIEKEII